MSRRATDLSVTTLLWMGLLRLPAFSEILLAFAVLVGSIGALLSLNRKSELTVMRSAGMSVWQFLRPGLTVTLVLGILAVTLYNPLASAARSEAERLVAEVFGSEAGLLAASGEGSWLRQDGADGQSVINAKASSNQGLSLVGVIAFQFDRQGHFVERDRCRARSPARRLLGTAPHGGLPPLAGARGFRRLCPQHPSRPRAGWRRFGIGDLRCRSGSYRT